MCVLSVPVSYGTLALMTNKSIINNQHHLFRSLDKITEELLLD